MKSLFRITTFTVVLLIGAAAAGRAQDRPISAHYEPGPVPIQVAAQEEHKYRVQILVGGVVSEIKNPLEIVHNSTTLNFDGKVNVINKGGWTFGPAFNFQRAYHVEIIPEGLIYADGV